MECFLGGAVRGLLSLLINGGKETVNRVDGLHACMVIPILLFPTLL